MIIRTLSITEYIIGLVFFLSFLGVTLLSLEIPSQVFANTTIVSDTFTRSESNSWGSADTGGAYTLTGNSTSFAVDGSIGTITAPTASVSRWAVLESTNYQDVDITFKLKTDKVASGTSQEYFVIARYIDSSNMYRGKIRFTPSNGVTLQAGKVVSGSETLLATQETVTGLTHSADSYINIRMKVTGASPTTYEMKAWADGDAEPGTWTVSTTDSEAVLQTSGSLGLRLNMPSATANAPIVASYDDFTVTTSDVIPSPTPSPTAEPQSGLTLLTDTFTRSTTGGWGTSDSGGDYIIDSGSADDFNTTGTEGTINSPTAAVSRSIIVNNALQQDLDIQFKVKLNSLAEGTSAEVFWLGRRVDPSNVYRGKIRMTPAGSVTLQATKVVGGSETLLGTQESAGLSFSADEYVYVRSQVTGTSPTTIKMKAWLASDTEPASWDYTVTDSEAVLQAQGSIGFRTNVPSGVTNTPLLATFDDISVTTGDGQINEPTADPQEGTTIISDTFTRSTANGLGTADTGGDYTINSGANTYFATNGSEGVVTNNDASTSRDVSLEDAIQRDVDVKVKVKIDKIPTNSAAEGFITSRRQNIANHYRHKFRFTSSNGVTVQTSKVVEGVETLLGSQKSTGISYTADTYIWVRTKIVGTSPSTIYMKAWLASDDEPVSWQYIYDDYSEAVLQEAGAVGLRTNLSSSFADAPLQYTFDDFTGTTTDLEIYDPSTAPSPSPSPSPPSEISIQVNLNSNAVVSKLEVGATHTQESLNSGGDSDAIIAAQNLLQNGLYYQNQHIHGFGASNLWDDPSKDVDEWNWSSLDNRVKLMRDTGSVPIITLCCAPTWMVDPAWSPGKYNGSNTDWGQLEEAPLDIYESDFAYMVQEIVERYDGVTLDNEGTPFPKILRFQVWNEMKGLWDRDANTWNIDKYNRMYELVYDNIKSVRSDALIGGPYVRFSKYLYPTGVKISTLKDSAAYGTVDNRDLLTVTGWLNWLDANRDGEGNLKAQFITVDASITTKDVTDGTFPTDIWNATKLYADINDWLNTEMTSTISTQLPIWWAEDYVGKVNGNPDLITAEVYQASALATMLRRHVLSGTSVSLRWGPEEQINNANVAQGNKQNLFTSTEFSGGGQPYTNYTVYKYFNDYFSAGTNIYTNTSTPSSDAITALSSASKTLLINKTNSQISVNLTANSTTATYQVGAYQVRLVDTPASSNSSSSNTSTSSSNQNTLDCPWYYILCPTISSNGGWATSNDSDSETARMFYLNPPGTTDLVINIRSFNPYYLALFKGIPLPWQQGFNVVSEIFEFSGRAAFNGYPVSQLEVPATVIMHYNQSKLDTVDPRRLRLASFNQITNRWQILPYNTVLNQENRTVANVSNRLGYYVVVYPKSQANLRRNSTLTDIGATQKAITSSQTSTKATATPSPTPSLRPTTEPNRTNVERKNCFLFLCF